MPTTRISDTAHFFLETALPQVTQKTLAQLQNVAIFRGAYVENDNTQVTTPFGAAPAAYALQVAGPLTGSGVPELDSVAVAAGAPKEYLFGLAHLADVVNDSEDEIRRVMADYDTFAGIADWAARSGSAAAPTTGTPAAGTGTPATGTGAPAT